MGLWINGGTPSSLDGWFRGWSHSNGWGLPLWLRKLPKICRIVESKMLGASHQHAIQDRTRDVVKIQSAARRFLVRNRRFQLLAKVGGSSSPWGCPRNGWSFSGKIPMWMIWRYPHFRKPSDVWGVFKPVKSCKSLHDWWHSHGGTPKARWSMFIREKPKLDDDWGYPHSRKHPYFAKSQVAAYFLGREKRDRNPGWRCELEAMGSHGPAIWQTWRCSVVSLNYWRLSPSYFFKWFLCQIKICWWIGHVSLLVKSKLSWYP